MLAVERRQERQEEHDLIREAGLAYRPPIILAHSFLQKVGVFEPNIVKLFSDMKFIRETPFYIRETTPFGGMPALKGITETAFQRHIMRRWTFKRNNDLYIRPYNTNGIIMLDDIENEDIIYAADIQVIQPMPRWMKFIKMITNSHHTMIHLWLCVLSPIAWVYNVSFTYRRILLGIYLLYIAYEFFVHNSIMDILDTIKYRNIARLADAFYCQKLHVKHATTPTQYYSNGKTDICIYHRDYAYIDCDSRFKMWITPRFKVFMNDKYIYCNDGVRDTYIKHISNEKYEFHTIDLKTGERVRGHGTVSTETSIQNANNIIRQKLTTYPISTTTRNEFSFDTHFPNVKELITYCPNDYENETKVSFDKITEDDLEMAHINIYTRKGHVYEQKGNDVIMTKMENTSMLKREGPVYGYKAVAYGPDRYCVARLIIPKDARVVQPIKHDGELIFTHKYRCDMAFVEGFQTFVGIELLHVEEAFPYIHKHEICVYRKGLYVRADDLDLNPYDHCGKGIHFHINPKHCLRWLLESVSANAIQEKYRATDIVKYNEFVRSAPEPPAIIHDNPLYEHRDFLKEKNE